MKGRGKANCHEALHHHVRGTFLSQFWKVISIVRHIYFILTKYRTDHNDYFIIREMTYSYIRQPRMSLSTLLRSLKKAGSKDHLSYPVMADRLFNASQIAPFEQYSSTFGSPSIPAINLGRFRFKKKV